MRCGDSWGRHGVAEGARPAPVHHRCGAGLFALVANRAIDPASKLSAAEWASCDVAVPGLAAMDEDQAYRAMDLLVEADAQAQVQEAVSFAVADLLNLEVDVLLFDTTSAYFERDTEEDGDAEHPGFQRSRRGFFICSRTCSTNSASSSGVQRVESVVMDFPRAVTSNSPM